MKYITVQPEKPYCDVNKWKSNYNHNKIILRLAIR